MWVKDGNSESQFTLKEVQIATKKVPAGMSYLTQLSDWQRLKCGDTLFN